ncbi:MAG: hypothetical protein QGG88_05825 [Gammaproteobacteria bacterium]|nr:hypothetical protein [Gammaproteobacteria bacterium]
MNNQQYLARLKKLLSSMPHQVRDEVLREIQSYLNDCGDQDMALLEKFGPPEKLAQQYLDGEVVHLTLLQKLSSKGRLGLSVFGAIVLVLVLIVTGLAYYYQRDAFNYADPQALAGATRDTKWLSAPWDGVSLIKVSQAEVVFYWHQQQQVRWTCDGNWLAQDQLIRNGTMVFQQAECLVYLPTRPARINVNQSKVTLIRPADHVDVKVSQSNIRIAQRSEGYQYNIQGIDNVDEVPLSTQGAAINIDINAFQSSLVPYVY